MVTAMIYDTLKMAEQLEHEAGFDAARARAMARIFAESAGGNLATREDILLIREDLLATKGELEAAIQGVRADVQSKIGGLEGRMGGLEGRMGGLERKVGGLEGKVGELQTDVRVLYWMTGTTLAGVAAILGTALTIALHVMHLG